MTQQATQQAVSFLGLGQMGSRMASHLVAAGYPTIGFDPSEQARDRFQAGGGVCVADEVAACAAGEIVLVCLPTSQAFVTLMEERLLPQARPGQVFVDHGTTSIPETRRLGHAVAERGAVLVDAPISGGEGGAAVGDLRLWVGGPDEVFAMLRPIFNCYANPEAITHMGPTGHGQVGKAVHQINAGLNTAAQLEAIAFGLRNGVDAATLKQSFKGSNRGFEQMMQKVIDQDPCPAESKFYELSYYLEAARAVDMRMPMMEALLHLCRDEPRSYRDPVNRPVPSIWQALMHARRESR